MSDAFLIAALWGASVLFSVTISQDMAKRRKRDAELWLLLAAFIGPVAPAVLYYLGEAQPASREQQVKTARMASLVSTVLALALVLLLVVPMFRYCFRI
ncbi:MAG: hypothetical protein AB2A00_01605 [Myxococcota bacterium]